MSRAAATARQSATVHQLRRADPSPLHVSALNPELRVLAIQYSERYCDEHGDYPDYGVAKAWAVKQMALDRCFWAKDHDRKEMLKHGRAARKAMVEAGSPAIGLATFDGRPAEMFRAMSPARQRDESQECDPSCPIFLTWASQQDRAAARAGKEYPLYVDLVHQYMTEVAPGMYDGEVSA